MEVPKKPELQKPVTAPKKVSITAEMCDGMAEALTLYAKHLRRARPGRPRREDVTQALRMEAAGETRRSIYQQLGKSAIHEQHALREAMRQRKFRKRARDKVEMVTPTKPAELIDPIAPAEASPRID